MQQCSATEYTPRAGDIPCTAPAVYDTPYGPLCGTHASRARVPADQARMIRPQDRGQDA